MNSPLRPQVARITRWLLAAVLLIPLRAAAQSDPKNPRVQTVPAPGHAEDLTPHPGLVIAGHVVIGQPAPAFELDSSLGRPVQLTSLRGDWTALFFMPRMNAAPDFNPTQLALQTENIRLVGVCHERARTVESFAQRNSLSWVLLADVTGEVGAMYGVWDEAQRGFIPGLVLLDSHGIVRYASIGRAFSPDQLRDIVLAAREKS